MPEHRQGDADHSQRQTNGCKQHADLGHLVVKDNIVDLQHVLRNDDKLGLEYYTDQFLSEYSFKL